MLRVAALAALVAGLALAGCGGGHAAPARRGAGCADTPAGVTCGVLFLGNSYTAANDLPAVFAQLAGAGGHPVAAAARDPGGATLADHLAAADTSAQLGSRTFNVVVLQEQSQIPASPALVAQQMLPAARGLVGEVRRVGAEPLLLQTWAHRDGWPEAGIPSYAWMQAAVQRGYADIGRALGVRAVPVGEAWATALADRVPPPLWQADGSHPATSGTYLAACVLYASIFGRSPQGLPFRDGLTEPEAARLQAVAWAAVR